jgi:hypothetical protein
VHFIDDERKAGRTVYVHCFAGMNRSGMVVTAYLMYEHSWSARRSVGVRTIKTATDSTECGVDAIPGGMEDRFPGKKLIPDLRLAFRPHLG